MPIFIPCPCGRQVQARDEHAGMQVRCPICGRTLLVPQQQVRAAPVALVAGQGQTSAPKSAGIAGAGGRYWLLIGGSPQGPFTVEQLRSWLAAGQVVATMLACPEGNNRWQPLGQLDILGGEPVLEVLPASDRTPSGKSASANDRQPEVLEVLSIDEDRPAPRKSSTPLPSPRRVESGAAGSLKAPWNPLAIAWLGLLFSPAWCAVMAALNGRRLRPDLPLWRPLAIGFGSLGLSLFLGMAIYQSYLVDLVLYCGAVGLIWFLDLRPQQEAFRQFCREQPGAAAGWVWPSLAGAPLAVLVFLGFVVEPLLPLEPREVCERFAKAKNPKEAEKYATLNLVPALQALDRLPAPDDKHPFHFELTDEGPAPPELGGYVVGCRGAFVEGGQRKQLEGVFHLVNWNNGWKIEDIYLVSLNRQPLEQTISVARDYPLLLEASQQQDAPRGSGPPRTTPVSSPTGTGKGKSLDSATWRFFALVIGAAVAGFIRWRVQRSQPKKESA